MKQLERGFAKTLWLMIGVGLTMLWNVKKQCITLILLMKKMHGKKTQRRLSTTTNDIFTTCRSRQKYKCHIKNCTQKLKLCFGIVFFQVKVDIGDAPMARVYYFKLF